MTKELVVSHLATQPGNAIPLTFLLEGRYITDCPKEIQVALTPGNFSKSTIADLANSVFNTSIKPKEVHAENRKIEDCDRSFAKQFGFKILPFACIKSNAGQAEVWMGPALVPMSHPLSKIGENESAAVVISDHSDPFIGSRTNQLMSYDETTSAHCLRVTVADHSLVLFQVATELGKRNINIKGVHQPKSEDENGKAVIAFLLSACKTKEMQSAADAIRELNVVSKVNTVLRVIS